MGRAPSSYLGHELMDEERETNWLATRHRGRREEATVRMGREWRRPCGEVGAMFRCARHQSFSLPTGFGGLLGAE